MDQPLGGAQATERIAVNDRRDVEQEIVMQYLEHRTWGPMFVKNGPQIYITTGYATVAVRKLFAKDVKSMYAEI